MAVWRLQVNTGGTNVADYCLKNHVAAMGWSLRELTQAERSGIHTFLDYCNLARTQYKSFDSVCRMVEDVKEGDLLWMRSRNEGKYYIARVKSNSTWVFREDAVQIDAANQLTNIDWYPATDKADEESVPGAVATSFIMGSTIQRIKKNGVEAYSQMLYNRVHDSAQDLFNYYGCKVRNRAAIIFWEDKHMRKNLTEIVFILDRSGSMSGLERDTIGGFNSMIEQQKKAEGEALISTVLFDNVSEVLHDRVNVRDIRPMTDRDYTVRGCTALLDAIGGAIHHIGNVHKYARPEDVPEHTMFIITTDGMENASRRYNSEKVKQMIERQKAKYGWEFLFLGANIDAVETASQFGIGADRAVNYQCDSEGTALNYEVVSEAISSVRCSAPLSADWKKRIDEDYKKRGGRKHK